MSCVSQPLITKDMEQLQLTDEQFKAFTWSDVCQIIKSGQVDRFRRWPSDLAKYLAFKEQTLQTYPSIEKFILAEKLNWPDPPVAHSSVPYMDPRDYQIRLNDHPYAFGLDVTHIVVWSALRFPVEVSTQERMVRYEKFVEEHFGEIPGDNRRWFLNWGSIQSVPGLEHFHVLLRDAEPDFVKNITTQSQLN